MTRYYLDAGAGGVAVGVHTTQFAIRDRKIGLFRPVLELAAETARSWRRAGPAPVLVAGVVGRTRQALAEARTAADLGYDAALVSLAAFARSGDRMMVEHVAAIGEVLPVMAFYLQPAVGGRRLDYSFWRRIAELDCVVAAKVAPFDRYATLDVLRAIADSGRGGGIALYTGNDDHVVLDLLSRYRGAKRAVRFVGGLLGHWAFWTREAVRLYRRCRRAVSAGPVPAALMARATEVTAINQAVFDPGNGYRGCIPGIHEMLRRQGLLAGRWCLDPSLDLSPHQAEQIDRVVAAYRHLADDGFVAANRDRWLA